MAHTALLSFGYAAVLVIGGIMGYVRAKSNVSLIAGIGSGLVAAIAGLIAQKHEHTALAITGFLALVMTIVFAIRYRKTQKPMPAMPMMAISVVVLLVCGYELLKAFGKHTSGA